jgi:hypothetical protein
MISGDLKKRGKSGEKEGHLHRSAYNLGKDKHVCADKP